MSQITIQCRLVCCESTRHQLWQLMAQKNTLLINELLEQVGKHAEFETWREKGKLPAKFVESLCDSFKTDPRFIGQPARFYTSATLLVKYIYKSWLASLQRLQRQLERRTRWLEILKSDSELVEASSCSLDALRKKAAEILIQAATQSAPTDSHPSKGKKRKNTDGANPTLSSFLFQAYCDTQDVMSRCAIAYLIKNGCKVNDREEDPDKFAKRRRQAEIRVERLTQQLKSRMPKGRDLTSDKWLETLAIATCNVPKDEDEAKFWQSSLLRKSSLVPFPVAYETNTDLTWFTNQKGRICVIFSGLSEHTFEIYCDSRQLHWFKRFLEDQQTKRDSKDQHSSSLFTLRSVHLAWQEFEGKGDPWNVHRLTLYCTVDTRLWTTEGTEQVCQEKAAEIAKVITRMKEKGELSKNQDNFVKRKHSTLARINNPFPRPSKPIYQGQSHILVGVSLGLDKPATAAVVDAVTGKVIAYQSIRQLLGENYELLNRQRQQQQRNSQQRHKAQKRSAPNSNGESELGQYVDRLLAQAIVALAQTYLAGSIVLPKLGDMREIVHSEVQARAEAKCSGCVEAQAMYAKQYRKSVHYWSYGRLIQSIHNQAVKTGIAVEEGQQPIRGSPQEKARNLAITAYHSRQML